ncbi:hypothetical protein CN273_31670 [Bacillus thuringiensis]|nr:hypothetical protein CN273_31670 [Bacillus thuringiensis]
MQYRSVYKHSLTIYYEDFLNLYFISDVMMSLMITVNIPSNNPVPNGDDEKLLNKERMLNKLATIE